MGPGLRAVATATAVVLAASACSPPVETPPAASSTASTTPAPASPPPDPATYAAQLRDAVTVDALMDHLTALQRIADANGGNRALGTPGYDASADYVADALRDRGFDVETTGFELRRPFADDPVVTVGRSTVPATPLQYTAGTPADGVSGRLVPVGDLGCAAADYERADVAGAVALVDRGRCPFGEKQTLAAESGAVAVVVADNVDGETSGATLGGDTDVRIPVVMVSRADGARLRDAPETAAIRMNAGVRTVQTRNVIAQTSTGSPRDVVVVGGHLDGVEEGPGINDNGSGVAAVLETALQMGSSPPVRNAVRFAFWGAEENGLLGSAHYVESLGTEQRKDIALYLNFDMVGSPNPAYFTLDGDQSSPPVPEGSAGIERTLADYLASAGKPPQDSSFGGGSDYASFTRVGIPAGGIFSGAGADMTAEQAELWDGDAGRPYDPNYHRATDTVDRIDRTAMGINGSGAAYATALYSQDLGGPNGVPGRADRVRD